MSPDGQLMSEYDEIAAVKTAVRRQAECWLAQPQCKQKSTANIVVVVESAVMSAY